MDNNNEEKNIEKLDVEIEKKSKQEEMSDKIIKTAENIINTKDISNALDPEEIKIYKMQAILCYLGPLIILPIINKLHKKSKYMSFHINQGINIIILYIITFILTGLITSIFKENYIYTSFTPSWVTFINFVITSITIAINVFGLINTTLNKSKELPLIGKFKFIKWEISFQTVDKPMI